MKITEIISQTEKHELYEHIIYVDPTNTFQNNF